jgi:nucleoside-diphosphate-sugar epimerase
MTDPGRVLVTGASGFIGRHVVPLLRSHGFDVHAIGRDQADLLLPGAPAALIDRIKPTHLLHLAWNVAPGRFWSAPDNLNWVAATLLLHRAFAAAGGQRAVYAGSCTEYDWSHERLDEAETPCAPATLYGKAKDSLRRLLEASPEGVHLAWARIFYLYGPHEAPARLVPDVITALLAGREALCGDGLVERDFLHVADVAAALVALLESAVTGPVNIASGLCLPLRAVVMRIAEHMGRPELVRFGMRPTPASEPRRLAASIHRLRDEVGFRPSHSLDQGLMETIAWWRTTRAAERSPAILPEIP